MIFYIQPTLPWDSWDFKLIEAYQILQDETCPKCGQPIWLCRSEDPRVAWKRGTSVCYASRELEERSWRRDNPKKKATAADKERWGLIEFATPFVPPTQGETLPTRKDFYESLKVE